MRRLLTFPAVLIGAGIALGVEAHDAGAGPLPSMASAVGASAPVVAAGWRRNWRRYEPELAVPETDAGVAVDVVPGETPPLIAIVPVRPASCGQYRYWNGNRCVDARYNNPYIGPR